MIDPTGLWSWGQIDDLWDDTGGKVMTRIEESRAWLADRDLGTIDWGSGGAGVINLILGYNKVGSGGIVVLTGTVAIPFTGGLSGPPAYLVGAYQLATGAGRIMRGSRQLSEYKPCETKQERRLGSNATRLIEGLLPNTDSWVDFLGGLP